MFCLNGENQSITIVGEYKTETTNIQLTQPRTLQFDSRMNLYVSNPTNHRIVKFINIFFSKNLFYWAQKKNRLKQKGLLMSIFMFMLFLIL